MEKVKKGNIIEIKFDLSQKDYDEKNAKSILRKLAIIRKKADITRKQININVIGDEIGDTHKIKNPYEYDIKVAINAVQIQDKKDRCNYLYDEICYYLDFICFDHSLCEFKHNKCFVKKDTDVTMGCCHHYPNKYLGIFYQKKMIPCKYLGENGCTTKTIGCKLFLCDDLNKKGYKLTVFNVLLIRYFFNIIQKYLIRTSIFMSEKQARRRLLRFNF